MKIALLLSAKIDKKEMLRIFVPKGVWNLVGEGDDIEQCLLSPSLNSNILSIGEFQWITIDSRDSIKDNVNLFLERQ